MSYSTLTDMVNRVSAARIIRLVNDERISPVPTIIDTADSAHSAMIARVNEVIAIADATIDAYIGNRYKLPLGTAPDLLRTASTEIAFYKLLARANPKIEESWQQLYDGNIKILRDISGGKIALDGVTLSKQECAEVSGEFVDGNAAMFTRNSLGAF